jgi:hypothetical protein
MVCALIRPTLRCRPIRGIGHTTVHAMLATFLFITPQYGDEPRGYRDRAAEWGWALL